MLKYFIKITLVILIFGMVNRTFAYFSDRDSFENNNFSAGILKLSLAFENDFLESLSPTQSSTQTISLENIGTLEFQYKISASDFAGDLCSHLNLDANLDGAASEWTGALNTFDFPAGILISPENWILTLSLNHDDLSLHNQTCNFKFIFEVWQPNLPDNSQGFSAREEIENVVQAGVWESAVLLNEFLPNPNGQDPDYGFDFGEDSDDMPQGEWVELYNNGSYLTNLAGWYLKDEADHTIQISDTNTEPPTTFIGAQSWLLVYLNQAILNNSGSGGNPADTIYLYDNQDNLVDFYSYYGTSCLLEPTPGSDNATITPLGCNQISQVSGNKSYARIPDGIGPWYDPIPTPGHANLKND